MDIEIHFPDIVSSGRIPPLRQEIYTFPVGRPHRRQVVSRVVGQLREHVPVRTDDKNIGVAAAVSCTDDPFTVRRNPRRRKTLVGTGKQHLLDARFRIDFPDLAHALACVPGAIIRILLVGDRAGIHTPGITRYQIIDAVVSPDTIIPVTLAAVEQKRVAVGRKRRVVVVRRADGRDLPHDRPLVGIDHIDAVMPVVPLRETDGLPVGRPRQILHPATESPLRGSPARSSRFHHDIVHIVLVADISDPGSVGRNIDQRIDPPPDAGTVSGG